MSVEFPHDRLPGIPEVKFVEPFYRNVGRAMDALSGARLALASALGKMEPDTVEFEDGISILLQLDEAATPLGELRTRTSEAFDTVARQPDYGQMRMGIIPYPGQRPYVPERLWSTPGEHDTTEIPQMDNPNRSIGDTLIAFHGGVDEALMAHPSVNSREHQHILAATYVQSGIKPPGLSLATWRHATGRIESSEMDILQKPEEPEE